MYITIPFKVDTLKNPTKPSQIGFTDNGIPEPTLADIYWNNSSEQEISIPNICDLYYSVAASLVCRLKEAFDRLSQSCILKSGVHSLAEESLDLLVKEAS